MNDLLSKLENSIENLKNKKSKIYLFVQDTKGNAKASVKYIYDVALVLKNNGYDSIILHEKPDYFGVQDWMGSMYMDKLPHVSVEGQNLQISPEDTIIVPEIFGYVMGQLANLPCAKIVLCQSYDNIFETLQPGQVWSQFGFTKCITTSDEMKKYISTVMKGTSIDVIPPLVSSDFEPSKLPVKPIIAIHSREQRDSINFIKSFYVKFPQYRWISFRDMRGVSYNEFSNTLRDCMLSVWIDDISSFGTFPLESMASGVPVLARVPNLIPSWLKENNGIWVTDKIQLQDFTADFVINWLEDNVSEGIIDAGIETASKFKNSDEFEETVISTFEGYSKVRAETFGQELNKQQELSEQNA